VISSAHFSAICTGEIRTSSPTVQQGKEALVRPPVIGRIDGQFHTGDLDHADRRDRKTCGVQATLKDCYRSSSLQSRGSGLSAILDIRIFTNRQRLLAKPAPRRAT